MSDGEPAKMLFDVKEVAERLGIGRSHLYGYILRGELRSISLGRRRKVSLEAINDFVRRQEQEGSRR